MKGIKVSWYPCFVGWWKELQQLMLGDLRAEENEKYGESLD